ncbi:MAG TPA: alpha/beta fold hydrolase [Gaiellales bacterium]|nr:alpha/beta fold hydrolase [Gaiellales bacterium]
MAMIDAAGVQLYAEQAGQGDDVVFISGLADEGACWADQAAALGNRWQITTFDNRGVGRSETPPGEYRTLDFAADTVALMDALGIEQAHVVGSSMGGAIAQELALAHPGRVRSLVLNGTYCRGDHFFREVIRSWQWAAQKSDNLRDFLNVVNLWCFAPRIYNEGIMEEWLTAAAESPYAQSVDAFCRSADALIEHDAYDRVGAISVPTLVTVGELDLCLPERFGRELADRIPGAQLLVIAGQGHQPFQEGPEQYNTLLAEFWSSVA